MTKEQFAEKIPSRLDGLSPSALLSVAADATEAAKHSGTGWQDKAALWQLAAACLGERSSRTMLFLTWVIVALTAVVTVATVYQAAGTQWALAVATALLICALGSYVSIGRKSKEEASR